MFIPQAFLNGMRSQSPVGGMQDVRGTGARSQDQSSTVSGNPGLAYNMPMRQAAAQRVRPQYPNGMDSMDAQLAAAQQQQPQGQAAGLIGRNFRAPIHAGGVSQLMAGQGMQNTPVVGQGQQMIMPIPGHGGPAMEGQQTMNMPTPMPKPMLRPQFGATQQPGYRGMSINPQARRFYQQ